MLCELVGLEHVQEALAEGLVALEQGRLEDADEAVRIMHEAIDEGLTFFDNCWDYHQGRSEELMGRALSTGGRRDKVFLMTKVCGRDDKTAQWKFGATKDSTP